VDVRSRYQDESGHWTWGRGVSLYLDEFQKLVWSLAEAVQHAVYDSSKQSGLIKIAGDEIHRRSKALQPSGQSAGPRIQPLNIAAGTSRSTGEPNYLKETADAILRNESDLRSALIRAASDPRMVPAWLNEVKYMRGHILSYAGACMACEKYNAGADGAVEKENKLIEEDRAGPPPEDEEGETPVDVSEGDLIIQESSVQQRRAEKRPFPPESNEGGSETASVSYMFSPKQDFSRM
jgi:hypothetical protein